MKNMENKKKLSIFRILALCLQTAAELFTIAVILKLDMLPTKFLIPLCAGLLILSVATGLFMFIKVKGKVAMWRRVVSCVLALAITCGCAILSKVAWDANSLIDNVTDTSKLPSTPNTYVLVLQDDPAQTLADTKGYTFGAVENYDVEHTEQMIHAVSQETMEQVVELQYFPHSAAMADALYDGTVGAVILNGAGIAFLTEEEGYEDFLDRARILYTLSFDAVVEPFETEPTEPLEEVVQSPFIVYISGSDTRSDFLDVSLSDVNILAVVNPLTKQILLLNTPRDYFVPNPAGNGALDKLTHCGRYGVECSIQALEDLYGLEIDYYGRINFKGFEGLVDAIGGITFYSDRSFPARDTYIEKGENHLTGAQALDLARERYHLPGGDNDRGKNQMKMVKAVIEKITSSTALISNYAEILSSLEGMVTTSFRPEEISALVKMQLSDMAKWDIQTFAVTGPGGSEITYSYRGDTLYVMWPDEKMVEFAGTLVQRVLDGEVLTEADVTYS